tara:strand:- start:37747 stop:38463 length:717 start_codon:yes stop_codon:yes gene_type:complete
VGSSARKVEYSLDVAGLEIQVIQKAMKTVRFTVYPPDGRIRVAAPIHLKRSQVLQFIQQRIPWMKKQKLRVASLKLAPAPEYIEGETHLYLGQSRKLVFGDVAQAGVRGKQLVLPAKYKGNASRLEKTLESLYRKAMKEFMERRIPFWEKEMSVRVKAHGVRKMKTLWGSCNVRTHRIWLNLELARMSEKCIEAILVHEMVHLKERLHNHRFYGFMNTYLPDWMEREKELKEIGVRYY